MVKEVKKNEICIEENYAVIKIESQKYGKVEVKIDIQDIEKVSKYYWCVSYQPHVKGFYVVASARNGKDDGKILRLHRLITDCPKGLQVDHINKDTLDNRKINLRNCTNSENGQNKGTSTLNTSGVVGVDWVPITKKWRARIQVENKVFALGYFKSLEQAKQIRELAELKYFTHKQTA